VHYIARHGESRVARAVLIGAVPPIMITTPNNPSDLSKEVFDGTNHTSPLIAHSSAVLP
jgi:non-heme chloroperoxidase